jgi:cytochrome c oxidase cbb3-type subunit 3
MSDFTTPMMNWIIFSIVLGGIAWLVVLLLSSSKVKLKPGEEAQVTGHVWDENLEELNTPLPRWWLIMFYVTIVYGLGYLALYPGLGTYKGLLGWTEKGQYEAEMKHADETYAPLFNQYSQQDLAVLAKNEDAMKSGQRMFLSYCAVCHGSDAGGATGFPNLRDNDWLWGGDGAQIKATILNGRMGTMPAWGQALGEEGVDNLANYVMSLSGREADPAKVAAGAEVFPTMCAVCHGPDAKGNPAMGAPNLTDETWLYGGNPSVIKTTIRDGRNGRMPAHGDFLGEAKVHVLAAYILSLSENK